MPYQLVHKGVVREFEFFAPVGWPYWIEQAYAEDGRRGLPLLIAMHGGGEEPEVFAVQWPFFTLLDPSCPNYLPNWDDKFFLLYPFGFSYTPKAACVPLGNGEPARGWNTGFAGSYLTAQSDVSFITNAVAAVESMLKDELNRLGIAHPPVDAHRRFAFGYSMGAMMAYHLAHKKPDYLAALWAISGAFGGRSHDLLTPTVTNDPQGTSSLSLFAHHGELDTTVPPGPQNDPVGRTVSVDSLQAYSDAGLALGEPEKYASSFRPLAAAIQEFKLYNDCAQERVPGPITATSLDPMQNSLRFVFQRTGAMAPANPEVIVYRDPAMEHTGFATHANRYFFPADVWDFFKNHSRV
jgi:predicted esterase